MNVLLYYGIIVPILGLGLEKNLLKLLDNRDCILKPYKLDDSSLIKKLGNYISNYNIIKNNIKQVVTFFYKYNLKTIIRNDYKVINYYSVTPDYSELAIKASRRYLG